MRRRTLDPPRTAAHEEPRPHFNPRSGWFRRIERATSLYLSRSVYPKLPGASWPYGWILRGALVVAEAEVPIAGLGTGLDGIRLLFVSDVHAGPFVSRGAVAEAFGRLGTLGADVVIHGGDLATSNVAECRVHAEAIARLTGPLGAFAVFGNHDHYTHDLDGLRDLYESCGARVLHNDAVAIERGGSRFALAGIDDWNIGRPRLEDALFRARVEAPDAPIVLASHNPDAFFDAARHGVALVLAGHTHGGQVRIPGRPVLVRMSRYRLDEGRYRVPGAELIVSRGFGVSGLPIRFACPPEALLVTLRRVP
ncbi:MAG TPA: metallophosphoesterase [Candidatus Bathyarchaeia archaeon]|jgi:predicted MPP superfamily phosphohydrolase|nr:metallophosphoesterase [Candidatus Bathyarchaeia archaeon]